MSEDNEDRGNLINQLKTQVDSFAQELGEEAKYNLQDIELLLNNLMKDEKVLAIITGKLGAVYKEHLITLTDRRILSLLIGRLGAVVKVSMDLDKINLVTTEKSISLGQITVQYEGSSKGIQVTPKGAAKFVEKINRAIESHKISRNVTSISSSDTISDLERLAALREKGLLSQSEFDEQKAKVLTQNSNSKAPLEKEELNLLRKIAENSTPKQRDPAFAAIELCFLFFILWLIWRWI